MNMDVPIDRYAEQEPMQFSTPNRLKNSIKGVVKVE